jgi:uncharacterized protein (TIGR00369 family)
MPFAGLLGLEVVEQSPQQVRGRLDWKPELCTAGGVLHGGVVMAVADTTGALCAFLNLPAGAGTTTLESKTNFLRAVRSGRLEAVSRPLHAGRSVIVVTTDLTDGDGRLVARVTQSQMVLSQVTRGAGST